MNNVAAAWNPRENSEAAACIRVQLVKIPPATRWADLDESQKIEIVSVTIRTKTWEHLRFKVYKNIIFLLASRSVVTRKRV